MEAAGKAPAPRGGRLIATICTLAAPAVLYLVARVAAGGLSPAVAATLPPADPAPLVEGVAVATAHPQFRIERPVLDLARRAVAADPLAAAPFFIMARATEQNGNMARAVLLMEEARRRRPDALLTRLQLVAYYSQARRHAELVREIDYALRVSEETRQMLLPELVRLLAQPAARQDLAALLAANPPWRRDFFNVARGQRVAPAHALDLLRLAASRSRDVSEEERLYVTSLIASGRRDLARARWLQSLPAAEQAQSRYLFNGNFRSGLSAPDFGWTLQSLDVGRADIVPSGNGRSHLSVQYHGGSSAGLAEQQIALAPGRYRIQIVGGSTSNTPAGQLFWTISCVPDGPELLRLAAAISSPQEQRTAAEFRVPPGSCSGQTLRLLAEPGEISALTEARFSSIGIADAR